MAPKRKNEILENYFCVCVTVFESRNLPDQNMDSMAIVQLGAEIRHTGVVRGSDKPYFNDYFVFDLESSLAEILDTVITVSVVQPRRRLRLKKLIGCISMDLGTVWSQPGRRLNNWLSMTLPSDPIGQENCQVRCDIRVEAAEELMATPQPGAREMKDVLGKCRARYMVRIYRCEGLRKSELNKAARDSSKVTMSVSFAGRTGSTTARPLRDTIDWNEQITFIEIHPPLYQKITIEIFVDRVSQIKKVFILSDMYVDLVSRLSFGPSYVHLYADEVTYRASILISINCELISIHKHTERMHGVTMQSILPLMQRQFGNTETFLCYCIIFDAVFLGRADEAMIRFSMSIGRSGKDTSIDEFNHMMTQPYRSSSGDISTIVLSKDKPCLLSRSDWPDTHSRLTNSNLISNLVNNFAEKVIFAENLIIRGIRHEAVESLSSAIDLFKNDCKKLSKLFSKGITDLDNNQTTFLIKQLQIIAASRKINKEEIALLRKAREWLIVLDDILQDIQETLPYVILQLESNKMTVGVCKLHPRDFYYSKEDLKKGKYCGKIIPIQIAEPKNIESIIASVNIWLWVGLWDQVPECINLLPPGHQDLTKAVTLPTILRYETDDKYYAVCHIFQGIIAGLTHQCHSLVKVYITQHTRQTRIVKDSLTPMWRSTLVFENLKLHTSPSYILDNPPLLTAELWNYGNDPPQLMGTKTVTSIVILEPHARRSQPNLQWISIGQGSQILAAFEIFQVTRKTKSFLFNEQPTDGSRLNSLIQNSVDLPTKTFRLELVFWGIRWINLSSVKGRSPHVCFECGTTIIQSDLLTNTNNNLNFRHDLKIVELELPEAKLLSPPIVVRVKNTSGYIGSEIDKNVYRYVTELPNQDQWNKLTTCGKFAKFRAQKRFSPISVSMPDLIPLIETHSGRLTSLLVGSERSIKNQLNYICTVIRNVIKMCSSLYHKIKPNRVDTSGVEEEEDLDWWSKYFRGDVKKYEYELEAVSEFGGFSDVLKTFNIKQSMSGDLKDVAKVKLMLCIYVWSSEVQTVNFQGLNSNRGVLQQSELSDSVKLLVRVYCVKAYNLHPSDLSGKADPYIEIATQSSNVSDKNNYIPKELNPVFGKCHEITVTLPTDFLLAVRVMDWDRFGGHDLIGETFIDLENRYYSKHRPSCGLASKYSETGVDSWRDMEKPTEILEKLCNSYNLPLPQYYDKSVLVASKEFYIKHKSGKNLEETKEVLALKALQSWKDVPLIGRCLVPEHIETRTLFHKSKPGVPQGKLEIWVDMFDLALRVPPPPVDISRRQPQQYELRVIIWNTAKVPLVDTSYFVTKKHTDIFVKGWLWNAEEAQSTDVHYTSINGDGYFNWRFIFSLSYMSQEKRIIITKKSLFDIEKSEEEVPAILHLQVWDSDRIGSDEFIGSMDLELYSMPKGAKSMNACKIQETNASERVNLFKAKHVRGWWPFIPAKPEYKKHGAGLLEAEFQLLTKDEAVNNPAGLGRAEPQSLPVPDRPDVRLTFWLAPIRLLYQLTCKPYWGKFLFGITMCAFAMFIFVGLYSIPLFIIKKIFDNL